MTSVADGSKPSSSPSKGKKDSSNNADNGTGSVEEKYPRDYGDKFERRESCLLQLPSSLPEKELCQNRPIIGQIRQGRSAVPVRTTTTTQPCQEMETEEVKVSEERRGTESQRGCR